MHTIQTTVYQFSELNEDAKEKAREWYREFALEYEWWDTIEEDAKQIGFEIKEFDLYHRTIKGALTKGGMEVAKAIKSEHGKDCDTYKAAKDFLAQVVGLKMLSLDFQETEAYKDLCANFTRELEECYLSMLDKEQEYLLSDECVDEGMEANEYTFTENGKRFG